MNKILLSFGVVALVAATALVGCGDDPTPPEPVPGDLQVTVVSPNGPEGAAVIQTADEGITAATAASAQVFHWRAAGLSRVVILLDPAGELSITLSVADLNNAPRLQIVEVAGPDNRLRTNLSGYDVTVEPLTGALP